MPEFVSLEVTGNLDATLLGNQRCQESGLVGGRASERGVRPTHW